MPPLAIPASRMPLHLPSKRPQYAVSWSLAQVVSQSSCSATQSQYVDGASVVVVVVVVVVAVIVVVARPEQGCLQVTGQTIMKSWRAHNVGSAARALQIVVSRSLHDNSVVVSGVVVVGAHCAGQSAA